LAAVVAVVAGFVTKDVPISILYGLFVGTVFFVLRQQIRINSQQERQLYELEDKALNLPTTLSHLEDMDPVFKRRVRIERDALIQLAKEAASGEMNLKARPLMQIIADFPKVTRPGDRAISTNSGVGYGHPQWDILRQNEFEAVDRGVDWTRIFIEPTNATPDEKKLIWQEMDRQKEKIKVRFIKESLLTPGVKQNSTLIVDRYFGYATFIKPVGSRLRQIVDEARVYCRREEVEKAKEVAEILIKLSEEYK
jgi:hypothetical protein